MIQLSLSTSWELRSQDSQLILSLRAAPSIVAGRILSYSYIPHLVVVLVEHDNNLGHVVQLWDSTQIVHGSLPLLVFVLLIYIYIYTHKQSCGISNSRHLAAFSEMGLRDFASPQGSSIVRTKTREMALHWGQGAYRKEQLHTWTLQLPTQPTCRSKDTQMQAPVPCWLEKSVTHSSSQAQSFSRF